MSDKLVGFFQFILGEEEGYLCISTRHAGTGQFSEAFYRYPDDVEEAVQRMARQHLSSNVYFCPTLMHERRRTKAAIHVSTCAWADLDTCPPGELLVKPTMVIETSPGRWQAYWLFNEPMHALDAEDINKRIAYYHKEQGADTSGWDLTQLLRPPGTSNHKYLKEAGLHTVKIVEVETALRYDSSDFDVYPPVEGLNNEQFHAMGELPETTAEEILHRVRMSINPRVWRLFEERPADDWSKALWQLELLLFDVGLAPEEVFVVVKEAACNKYGRDGRPDELLWKDVQRAFEYAGKPILPVDQHGIPSADQDLEMDLPPLLSDEERRQCTATQTLVEQYIEWASGIGDAAWQYHQAGAFTALSTLLAGRVQLPTSFGVMVPNLWFMILADTTLTRKTTAMDMAIDLITEIDEGCILATDGSIEGLMTALGTRPKRASVFLRDEFSGLLEMLTKRDYYAGMLETLTKLYDGKLQKRVLRKETIEVKDPILILFTGGIRERILHLLTYEHINSGFLPRFVFLTAESDVTKLRPLGPPSVENIGKRQQLVDRFREVHEHHEGAHETITTPGGTSLTIPKSNDARLTDDAWVRYNRFESDMITTALDSTSSDMMVPVFDRLSKSGLKVAVLMAATRLGNGVVVEEEDIIRAIYYVEQWRPHTMEVVRNIGKTTQERVIERIFHTVARNPGVSRSVIMRNFRLSARDADQIFTTLNQRGLVSRRRSSAGGEVLYPEEGASV